MATKLPKFKQIHNRSSLSRAQLLIFSLAFAVVGAIILISSFALDNSDNAALGIDTTVDGIVATTHADPLPSKWNSSASEIEYNLLSTPKKNYKINLPRGAKELSVGDRVKVKGKLKNKQIDVDSGGISDSTLNAAETATHPVQPLSGQRTTGIQRVLVIVATPDPVNVDSVMNSVKQFYTNVSYGKTTITWTTVSFPHLYDGQTCANNGGDIHDAINAADPTVDYTKIDRVVFILPDTLGCGYGGVGTPPIPISTNEGTIDLGTAMVITSAFDVIGVGHELGHSFDEMHARTVTCNDGQLPTPTNKCTQVEYGDGDSIMGGYGGSLLDFLAMERDTPNWLNPGNVLNVTQDGTYTLETVDINDSSLKAIWIQRDTCSTERLWVDYIPTSGVGIRISGDLGASFSAVYTNGDCFPGSITYDHSRAKLLSTGQSITDPNTGAFIKVLSTTSTTATVSVQLHRTDFTPPTFTWVSPGDQQTTTVTGTVNVQVNPSDNVGVQKVVYRLDDTTDLATVTSAPWKTTLDTTQLPDGLHYIRAVVWDTAAAQWGGYGNSSPFYTSMNSNIKVNNHPSTDAIPPTVSITAPTAGSTVSGVFPVNASASDNVAVNEVVFNVDGVALATDLAAPFTYSLDTNFQYGGKPYFTVGCHTLTAIAYDAAGNNATSTPVKVVFGSGSCSSGGDPAPGDINGDGHVDGSDLAVLLANWNSTFVSADLNKDGKVNVLDLSILLSSYGH